MTARLHQVMSGARLQHVRLLVGVRHCEHDERTVPHHLVHVVTSPALRCGFHQWAPLGRVGHDACGRGDVRRDGLLPVHDDVRVSRDVVDPVTRPVGPRNAADEEQPILLVEEDLDFSWLAGPATSRRQVDHLAVVKRLPGVLVHPASSRR
jgi:hypothetical protein